MPVTHEQADFMSLRNIIRDLAITVAAIVSSLMLDEATDGKLIGIRAIAWLSATTAVAMVCSLVCLLRHLRLEENGKDQLSHRFSRSLFTELNYWISERNIVIHIREIRRRA